MKIIQAISEFGDHVALYSTDREDDKIIDDIEECFVKARKIAALDKNVDVQDAADTYLEDMNISRVFADIAYVTL